MLVSATAAAEYTVKNTPEQVHDLDELEFLCKNDMTRDCVPFGRGTPEFLQCLVTKRNDANSPCHQWLNLRDGATGQDPNTTVRGQECTAEERQLCDVVQPGQSGISDCIEAKFKQFSETCLAEMLSEHTAYICWNDQKSLCGLGAEAGKELDSSEVFECLHENMTRLSPTCKTHVFNRGRLQTRHKDSFETTEEKETDTPEVHSDVHTEARAETTTTHSDVESEFISDVRQGLAHSLAKMMPKVQAKASEGQDFVVADANDVDAWFKMALTGGVVAMAVVGLMAAAVVTITAGKAEDDDRETPLLEQVQLSN